MTGVRWHRAADLAVAGLYLSAAAFMTALALEYYDPVHPALGFGSAVAAGVFSHRGLLSFITTWRGPAGPAGGTP